ncbi:ATP-binding cassette domain-containing protein [Gulosibacter bifidus]|uniref:ATP-binding cassette domain-containing protein n=1 Tax=Gulosibacter bifidus TaxID=272239 RepID=A0ABW5RK99_9MICO|nr:ABC transporter ATP-binding protein [Gulosibacter bifidus]
MWIRELVKDAPAGAWTCVLLIWLRTALLAASVCVAALAIDRALQGVLAQAPTTDIAAGELSQFAAWMLAAGLAVVGAIVGGVAELLPARIQAREEADWRQRLMGVAATLLDAKPVGAAPETAVPVPAAARSVSTAPASASAHPGAAAHGRPSHASKPITEGGIVDAATAAVEKTAAYRATFLAPTFAAFSAPVVVLIAWAIGVNPWSALALAGFVLLVPVCIVFVGKRLRQSNAEYRRREAEATEQYLEMIEGIGTLKVLGAAPRARDRFAAAAREAMRQLGRLLIQNQRMIVVNDAIFGILMGAAAIAIALGLLVAGQITAGQAIAATLLTVLLQEPIDRVGRSFYVGLAGRARRDQLDRMLQRAGDTDAAAREDAQLSAPIVSGEAPAPHISVHGLDYRHGRDRILSQLNAVIPAGKRTVIVGPSGAGKSTLLRCLAGLEETDGRIRFNGERVDADVRRAQSTWLGQQPAIVSGTVGDNLRFAAPNATDPELRRALNRAHYRFAGKGDVLEHPVGDRGSALSGGQRRRLMLARTLLRDRPTLLLDEATADLDRQTEAQIRATLREFGAGKTVIEIAHRIDTTLDADRILVVENGRVTASGTPAQLREQPGYYARALAATEALQSDQTDGGAA